MMSELEEQINISSTWDITITQQNNERIHSNFNQDFEVRIQWLSAFILYSTMEVLLKWIWKLISVWSVEDPYLSET